MQYRIKKVDKDFDGLVFSEENKVIKVPFTLIGELVNIKKIDTTNAVAIATDFSILEYSQDRIQPVCKYFSQCGGCKAQHFTKENYLKQKISNLEQLLEFHKISYPKPIEVLHHYEDKKGHRRRVIFSIDGKKIGFKAYRSNKVVEIDYCSIATENINKTLAIIKKIILDHNSEMKIFEIILSDIDGSLDILIKAKSKININTIESFQDIFRFSPIKKVTWNNEPLIIKEEINLTYGKYKIPFKSGGFLQAEKFGEETFIKFVLDNLKDSSRVLDLFCGFGSYAFSLLNQGNIEKINLFDIATESINSIKKYESPQLHAEIRDLFKKPLEVEFINNFNTIIINPPRAGALAQVKEIAKSNIEKIVMIYCLDSSSIRDSLILLENSQLKISQIKVVDQFIYSPHIEVLIYFDKK